MDAVPRTGPSGASRPRHAPHALDAVQLASTRPAGAPLLALADVGILRLVLSAERAWRTSETHTPTACAGLLGALAGFLASSLVNYNFGDAEVALLVWG